MFKYAEIAWKRLKLRYYLKGKDLQYSTPYSLRRTTWRLKAIYRHHIKHKRQRHYLEGQKLRHNTERQKHRHYTKRLKLQQKLKGKDLSHSPRSSERFKAIHCCRILQNMPRVYQTILPSYSPAWPGCYGIHWTTVIKAG